MKHRPFPCGTRFVRLSSARVAELEALTTKRREREWSRHGIGGTVQRFIPDDGGFARAFGAYWLYDDQTKGRE